jgi:hypothetical protein
VHGRELKLKGKTWMERSALLVFPIDLDSSIGFIASAKTLGMKIIGANSSGRPPRGRNLDVFATLPYINDPSFEAELDALVELHGITRILAPHVGVWWYLRQSTHYSKLLCPQHPYDAHWERHLFSQEWAMTLLQDDFCRQIPAKHSAHPMPALKLAKYVSLHQSFLATPGECDEEKLYALSVIFRHAIPGDIIEIGSLFGRSARSIAWLANQYKIGTTVCIDPWQVSEETNQGESAELINSQSSVVDLNKVFQQFLATAASVDNISYIRQPSNRAITSYLAASQLGLLESPGLNPVILTGSISVLHIDGNHRYEDVLQDTLLWTPHLKSGGWLLLDDYLWCFGDGPKRVGDDLAVSGDYDIGFVIGDTLLLRKN